jgi:predicted permease
MITVLLHVFPRQFRNRFRDEMLAAYLDRRDALLDAHAGSPQSQVVLMVRLTLSTSLNLLNSAAAEHHRLLRRRRVLRPARPNTWTPMAKNFATDSRHALRALGNQPGFVAVAVLTLALGIGANTAVFSVLNSVILNPLPYPESDRLVRIYNSWEGQPDFSHSYLSGFDFPRFRDGIESLETAGVMYTYRETGRDLTGDGHPQRVKALRVSSGYFETYRATPLFGRTFTVAEETDDARLVVLSNRLWRAHANEDPDILGKTITLDGDTHTVIGVMRPSFLDVIGGDVDLWVPQDLQDEDRNTRGNHYLTGIARLAPGVTLAQAQAQADVVQRQLAEEFPDSYEGQSVVLVPLFEDVVGTAGTTLYILWGAAGLVLLIACVNVANLSLARSVSRTKEIAIRTALGSGRVRLVGQLLTESVVVAAAGGVVGSFIAYWGVKALLAMSPASLARAEEVSFDPTLLGFAIASTVVTGLLFGAAPAVHAVHVAPNESLREGARGTSGSRRRRHIRSVLVAAQVSVALVLLIGAGLLISSFIALRQVDLGFESKNVATFEVHLPTVRYPTGEDRIQFHLAFHERLRALPRVEAVGAASWLPANGMYHSWGYGYLDEAGENQWLPAQVRTIEGDYFDALGIDVVRGRAFDTTDQLDAHRVALINEALATRVYGARSALGESFTFGGGVEYTVIGVVSDVAHEARGEFGPRIYLTHSQYGPNRNWALTYIVKTSAPAQDLFDMARRELTATDGALVLYQPRTMNDVLARQVAEDGFVLTLMAIFAGVALSLAAVGVYGVLSYSVNQRVHEIGIRMALGAKATQVRGIVVGQAALVAGCGMAAGLAGAFSLSRFMQSLLFEVTATDPLVFGGVAVLLGIVVLVAGYVPARRATKVDPMVALRLE